MKTAMWRFAIPVATVTLATPASAQEVVEPVIASAEVLSGRVSRTEWVVPVSNPAEAPRITLDFESSGLLDDERSALTLYLNGRPMRSARLSELDGRLTVQLPREEGFQRITLDSRLSVQGDPCLLDYRDSAWLTVLPSSSVSYLRAPTESPSDAPEAVAETAQRWRDSGGTRVSVQLPVARTTDELLAFIDVDHLVRDWGLEPSYGPPVSPDGPRLDVSLGEADDEGPWTAVVNPEIGGVARADGRRLRIHATDAAGLSRVVALLKDPEALALCPGSSCLVGPRLEGPALPDADRAPGRATFDLLDAGYPEGWVAAGSGRHEVQIVWPKPPWWRLQRWPELRLRARVGLPRGVGDDSRVTAHLNGQPLASWSLLQREDDLVTLSARIPPQFWSAGEWVVRIAVRLDEEADGCAALDPDELWVVVEPESGLYVPRTEELFDGISDFYDSRSVPTLSGDSVLALRHFDALAAVLHPFRTRLPSSTSFRWEAGCSDGCLQVGPVGEAAPTDTVVASERVWVVDRAGALRMPLLPESGHHQLRRTGSGLMLAVPEVPSTVSVPDLRALRGAAALYVDGQWLVREADTAVGLRDVGVEGQETLLMSREQQAARLIDFLWLCFALATVGLGGFWVWRGNREGTRKDDEELEYSGD